MNVTEMSPSAPRIGASLTAQQREAARLVAMGVSQREAAQRVGRSRRTVIRWCADADFFDHVEELRRTAWERVEASLLGNVLIALEVMRDCLVGEREPDSGYREGLRLLLWYLDRVYAPTCTVCGQRFRTRGYASNARNAAEIWAEVA